MQPKQNPLLQIIVLLTANCAVLAHTIASSPTPTSVDIDGYSTTLPAQTDASKYLSEIFDNHPPTQVMTHPSVTSLASALYSLELSWESHAMASSDNAAIHSAASRAGCDAFSSIQQSGYNYASIETEGWYQSLVPDDVKSDIEGYSSQWESVFSSFGVVGASTTSSEGGATSSTSTSTEAPVPTTTTVHEAGAPRCTGMAAAAAVAGVVGVLAAM